MGLGTLSGVVAGEAAGGEERPVARLQRQQLSQRTRADRSWCGQHLELGRSRLPREIRNSRATPGPESATLTPAVGAEVRGGGERLAPQQRLVERIGRAHVWTRWSP